MVHRSLVRDIIRANIDLWLAHQQAAAEDRGDNLDSDNEANTPQYQFGNIYLGSRQSPCCLGAIEQRSLTDLAFRDFTARLTGFVNAELRSEDTAWVEYGPNIEVSLVSKFTLEHSICIRMELTWN